MRIEVLGLLGASGHAKVVYEAIRAGQLANRVIVRDDDLTLQDRLFLDLRIETPIGSPEELPVDVHIAIGNNLHRARLAARLASAARCLAIVVHPAASVSRWCELRPGAFVAAQAVIAGGASVGECAIINHSAVIDHDCLVGPWTHVAPNATLGGAVKVGEGALIGAGAVILPGITVGKWAIIGAGAVVAGPVPDGAMMVGVPARQRTDV
jgi:sugar O-acyltransferase (sialic acid O-acetyltransferase NeuD family)